MATNECERGEGVGQVPWFAEWLTAHRRTCGGPQVLWDQITADQLAAWRSAFARHRVSREDAYEASQEIAIESPFPSVTAKLVIEFANRKHGKAGSRAPEVGDLPARSPGGPVIPWDRIEDPDETWERSLGCPECGDLNGYPCGIARRPCLIGYRGAGGEERAMKSSGGLLCRCALGRALCRLRDLGDVAFAFPDLQARPDLWGPEGFAWWDDRPCRDDAYGNPGGVVYLAACGGSREGGGG